MLTLLLDRPVPTFRSSLRMGVPEWSEEGEE